MSDVPEHLVIRRPVRQDAQTTLDLMIAYDVAEFGEPDSSLGDLEDQWSGIDLSRDAWLAYDKKDRLVGYSAVMGGNGRFTFDLYLHPGLAPDGLMEYLLEQCERRACERLKEAADAHAPASIVFSEDNPKHRQSALDLGYAPYLYHLGMQINLDGPPPIPAWPEGIKLRTAVKGEDDRLIYDFIQAAFDRPGRVGPTFQAWRDFMVGANNHDSHLWFLAFHGKALIGAALCFEYPERGWVRQLGVKQGWRRLGLGSLFLQHAFGVFYQRGFTQVGLVVESDNLKAYRLYERAGMKCQRKIAEYRKMLSCA
jgi:mycothiol synthase